jgi:hypothetical protein
MNARKLQWCLGICAACLTSGCGDGGGQADGASSTPIQNSVLAGFVGGKPWSLATADTDAFLSEDDPSSFFVTAYAEPAAPCETPIGGTGSNELILLVPKTVGDYALSFERAATFVIDPGGANQNLIATRGRIVVDEVTATSVRGGAAIELNANNTVNGQFQVNICPSP